MKSEDLKMKTILFDLDGTLLPMDETKFMNIYFEQLAKHFQGHFGYEEIVDLILSSTEEMIKNMEPRVNQEKFMETFKLISGKDMETYLPMFDEFYDTLFQEVKAATWQSQEMIQSVKLLKEKGYRLVIATNPLFPMKANLHRIRWAGFNPNDFEYITSFEENIYCKPNLDFYREVLSNINQTPEDCMMVGNDVFEDLISSELGLKTYLITNCMLNDHDIPVVADHSGDYSDFYAFVKTLKRVKA